ncbi:hypothetical protein [Streptomyces sp. NPDC001537]
MSALLALPWRARRRTTRRAGRILYRLGNEPCLTGRGASDYDYPLALGRLGDGLLLPRRDQVVSLHGHPRLLDTATGCIVAERPEVREPPTPVAALHSDGTRLAVTQPESIAPVRLP